MAETRRFAGLAGRSDLKAANQLGVIKREVSGISKFRRQDLDILDAYYEKRQYARLPSWDQSQGADATYIPVRKRAPRLQFSFAKMLASRLASKLVGDKNFPILKIEEDPETSEFITLLVTQSKLKAALIEPVRRMIVAGASLVRFSMNPGGYKIEHYLSKWCFPEFDENNQLEFVRVQYVFEDPEDLDHRKMPKKKWFRLDLSKTEDILYNNPEFNEQEKEPQFQVVERVDHNLGFVQAEWLRTADIQGTPDGPSLIEDVLEFIDEMNYSLSQSSTAVQYNQDPQLAISGMDEEDLAALIRSSMKAWNMGKEGKGEFLESSLNGVEAAMTLQEKVKMGIQDISRVILLDPEKMVGHAQSAKAMEVLHAPMVELIHEMQPQLADSIKNLVLKMTLATFIMNDRGIDTPIILPPGFKPKSLNITAAWPEIFQKTMQDLQIKSAVAVSVSSANLISRETMTKWLAKDFGVENIEEEVAKVNAQPVINPFGGF